MVSNNKENVNKIEQEIESLKNKITEIQSNCSHNNFTVKYNQELKLPKKICNNCNLDIGYASDKELKESGFL